MASGDPREIRIPRKLNSSTEEYAALGFEELGEARREYRDDPVYRLVRLPVGWTLTSEPGNTRGRLIVDKRGIVRASTYDTHKAWDRDAFTTVINVGEDAAGRLYGNTDVSLESIHFDLLTDDEIEDLVEELERMIRLPFPTATYAEYARRAMYWFGVLAERFRQEPIKTLP